MRETIVISDSESDSDSNAQLDMEDEEDVLQSERDRVTKRAKTSGGGGGARHHSISSSEAGPSQPSQPCQFSQHSQSPLSSLSGLLGTVSERKQLELERRQRQKARRRAQGLESDSDSDEHEDPQPPPPPTTNTSSRSYISEITPPPPRTIKPLPTRSLVPPAPSTTSTAHITAGLGTSTGLKPSLRRILAQERFPDGIVKRSFNPSTSTGVPFSDLILPTTKSNPAGLTHALVGSSMYDFDWLAKILPDQTSANAGRNAGPPPTFLFTAPEHQQQQQQLDKGGIYAMKVPGWALLGTPDVSMQTTQMKFLFLMYADRFRLVILSGDLVESEWTTREKENTAYVQDFPVLPSGRRHTSSETYQQLHRVIKSLAVPHSHPILKDLSRFDLTKGPTGLVASPSMSSAESRMAFQEMEMGQGPLAGFHQSGQRIIGQS